MPKVREFDVNKAGLGEEDQDVAWFHVSMGHAEVVKMLFDGNAVEQCGGNGLAQFDVRVRPTP